MRNFSIASVALAVAFAAGLAPAQNPAPQSPAPAPAPAAQAPTPASNPTATTAAEPAVQTSPTTKPAAKPAGDGKRFKTVDKMELDATAVTGNRELPKVLYIVPWKKADLGDLVGKPMNSLVDEVLAPVDRDVFKRQLRYYGALQPDKAASGAATEAQPEK